VELVVAKCGHCGAALRLDPSAAHATCDYCSVTSYVREAPADAPRITIAAPPEPLDETKLVLGMAIAFAVLALVSVPIALFGHPIWGVGVLIGVVMSALSISGYSRKKEYLAEARLLRERGITGRATVLSLGAGHDRNATLQLEVQAGGVSRQVAHRTAIPMLLVPRIASGMALPVLIHPSKPDDIEIQWHLV